MSINILQLVETVIEDATEVEVEAAVLATGQAVEVPGHIQVGTTGGQPVYLYGILTTNASYTPSSAPQPVATAITLTTKPPAASSSLSPAPTE